MQECKITENWQDPMVMAHILMTLRSPAGTIATAWITVDLQCLGLKDALIGKFKKESDYFTKFRKPIIDNYKLEKCNPALARKILKTARDYAAELGFEPGKKSLKALKLISQSGSLADIKIHTGGKDGRPLYKQGPGDKVQHIIHTLNEKVGEGNYRSILLKLSK